MPVKLVGRLAQMVKASAKTTSCKPLSRRYEFDSSQGQFVCLDMFVNSLAVTCRSGWFHNASCLPRGWTYVLAFLHLNSPRHSVASSRNKDNGRENRNDGITVNMLGLRLVVAM